MDKETFFKVFPNWWSISFCNRPYYHADGLYTVDIVRRREAVRFIDRMDVTTTDGIKVYHQRYYWAIGIDGKMMKKEIIPSIRENCDGTFIFDAEIWRLKVWRDQVNVVDVEGTEHRKINPSLAALMIWLLRPALVGNPCREWSAEDVFLLLDWARKVV